VKAKRGEGLPHREKRDSACFFASREFSANMIILWSGCSKHFLSLSLRASEAMWPDDFRRSTRATSTKTKKKPVWPLGTSTEL
jgi:hypothetical protein